MDKIQLKQVHKSFKGKAALSDISLSVPEGHIKILLGTSGCGKSTILRHMIGLIKPDSGEVLVDGEPLLDKNLMAVRRRMGYVIQDGGLFPHLTAKRNVSLMAEHLGWDDRRITTRIEELADLTHMQMKLMDQYPLQLSGGQRQRLSLMRALMLDPGVMLMDEPLGALDPITRTELQSDLRDIFQSLKKTVVIVTHDIGEAAYLGDEIVLLRAGKIVQQGKMADLLEHPADEFVTKFINAQRTALN